MKSLTTVLLASLAVAGGVALTHPALTQTKGGASASAEHRIQPADQMTWQPAPPGLPAGAQIAVLHGDPNATSGDFVIRLKAPAGYHVPPHSHPTNENLTVISGSLLYGMGTADRSQAATLPAGTYVYLPANNPHTVWAGEQGVVLEIKAPGPFGVAYVNPADDPRKEQASTGD